jgi:hypothetical protein
MSGSERRFFRISGSKETILSNVSINKTMIVGIKRFRQMSRAQANVLVSSSFMATAMRGALPFWHCPKKEAKNSSHNKAIATHRSLPNLHAFFSQCLGRNCFYYFCFVSLLACAWCMKAKIAVPVLRSLSLYCDGFLKFQHNDIFILVKIQFRVVRSRPKRRGLPPAKE